MTHLKVMAYTVHISVATL